MESTLEASLQPLYPTIGAKVLRRIKDIPWRAGRMTDSAFHTEFRSDYERVRPVTMVSYACLRALRNAIRFAVANNIPGDVVECGVAKGGSAILMGLALKRLEAARKLWLFDTFDGIPAPTTNDPDFSLASSYTGQFRGTTEEVSQRLSETGFLDRTVLVKGLFQDTLRRPEVERIAVMHLDGDWYDSIKVCLDSLFERVSPGGIVQIDDYGTWAGTRKATDEFVENHSLKLHYIDHAGRQIVKPI